MKNNKSLWQIFNEKVGQWSANLQSEAKEIVADRQKLYDLEVPVEMRGGMNRLGHEAKGKMLQRQFNALQKSGVGGALAAIDILLYHGRKKYFNNDGAKGKGPN